MTRLLPEKKTRRPSAAPWRCFRLAVAPGAAALAQTRLQDAASMKQATPAPSSNVRTLPFAACLAKVRGLYYNFGSRHCGNPTGGSRKAAEDCVRPPRTMAGRSLARPPLGGRFSQRWVHAGLAQEHGAWCSMYHAPCAYPGAGCRTRHGYRCSVKQPDRPSGCTLTLRQCSCPPRVPAPCSRARTGGPGGPSVHTLLFMDTRVG